MYKVSNNVTYFVTNRHTRSRQKKTRIGKEAEIEAEIEVGGRKGKTELCDGRQKTETETKVYREAIQQSNNINARTAAELFIPSSTSFAPGGKRGLETIRVVNLIYDAIPIHAELVRRTDRRHAVDRHARRRVDVEDL